MSSLRVGRRVEKMDTARTDSYPSAGLVVFRHWVRTLLEFKAVDRSEASASIRRIITIAQEPDRYIDELLILCAGHTNVDRAGIAIDILSQTGETIFDYAWNFLCRDVKEWTRWSDQAYEPNPDYWYILLRSVARSATPDAKKLRFIGSCANAATRAMREAVIEALADMGTAQAKEIIAKFAATDSDEFIKRIAQEALDDLES